MKNRFDLVYQEDSQENVITKENIETEKSNNINEHQTSEKLSILVRDY